MKASEVLSPKVKWSGIVLAVGAALTAILSIWLDESIVGAIGAAITAVAGILTAYEVPDPLRQDVITDEGIESTEGVEIA